MCRWNKHNELNDDKLEKMDMVHMSSKVYLRAKGGKHRGLYAGGWGCNLDFFFLSLLYAKPANISRKTATGGMASPYCVYLI